MNYTIIEPDIDVMNKTMIAANEGYYHEVARRL